VYPFAGNELGSGVGSDNGPLTTIEYVNGPAVKLLVVSVTLAVNCTVCADVGVPLMVSVAPLVEELNPSAGKPVTVHE
jgi:hypothetical protein